MKAADIMTRRVVTANADTSIAEIARLMLSHRVSAIPVIDDQSHVIGIVSEHDLLRHPPADSPRAGWMKLFDKGSVTLEQIPTAPDRRARDVMQVRVRTVSDATPIGVLASLMQRRRLKHLPVLCRGKLIGIVSRGDVIAALLRDHPEARQPSLAYRFFGE
jgi:CBS-domain-containing membrane protein